MSLPSLSALPPLGVAFSLSPFSRAQRGQLCLLSSVCRPLVVRAMKNCSPPPSLCARLCLSLSLVCWVREGLDNHGREGPRLKVGGGQVGRTAK